MLSVLRSFPQYVYHGEANESSEAASEGPGRRPYFTSASNAEAWWRGGRGSSEIHSEEHSGGNDAASPHANGDHPEDSASDGLGHGAWLQNGAYVEVKMEEEGLHSSRYQARILELDGDKAFVEFPAFFNDDDEKTMVTEWVNVQQLWPPPPPPPPDFFDKLSLGAPLDFYLEEGWWEVTLQRTRITATGRTSYQVVSGLYKTEHWTAPDRLRPRWIFVRRPDAETGRLLEYWEAAAPKGLMVWEETNGAPLEAETSTKVMADIDHSGAGGMEHGHNGMPSSEREVEVEVAAEPTHGGGTAANGHGSSWQLDSSAEQALDSSADRSETSERERLQTQLVAMHRLASQYHARVCEVQDAALRMFPLAHSAVVTAGGTLAQPECFTRPVPPLPPLPSTS